MFKHVSIRNPVPVGELYEDNTKMLMQNLGATQTIMEENEDDYAAASSRNDRNETDEDKNKRMEGKHALNVNVISGEYICAMGINHRHSWP